MSTTSRVFCCFVFLWFLLFFSFFPRLPIRSPLLSTRVGAGDGDAVHAAAARAPTPCPAGTARLFVYDLPCQFNFALSSRCRTLLPAANMCPDVSNGGLGRPLPPGADQQNRTDGRWYATHDLAAEVIFHERSLQHPCRTLDPDEAELFYVPFYGALDVSGKQGEPDLDGRRRLTLELAEHVAAQKPWQRRGGRDHFLVLGRPAWDFMACDYYGFNRLLGLPAVEYMTVLTVERVPAFGTSTEFQLRYPTYFPTTNQFGLPYPSYFHPRSAEELVAWQEVVSRARRTHLFAFVGGRKEGAENAAAREAIFGECRQAPHWCRLVDCDGDGAACGDPRVVLEAMMEAHFCLQPPGDWFTRRSVFDAVLAGCVPVFFSELTAQLQYGWYLPADAAEYSVLFGRDPRHALRIGEELAKIPKAKVAKLQRRVIELIPGVTYAHPDAVRAGFADAVDVALSRLSDRVRNELLVATDGDQHPPGSP